MQKNNVTILIPSYNDKKKVYRLLKSLEKSTYKNLEIIVIVGGSENTLTEGPKKFPKVKWVDSFGPIDVGQTGRYNLGFAYANPNNHIMMIDSDVVVDKDMVTNLVNRLNNSSKVGVVTPMVLYMEDHNWVNQAGANVDLLTGKVTVGWGKKDNYLTAKQVQNSGTVMLFKNSLVKKIGCFEDWYMCYFDPDYCLRAIKAGFEVWYEPTAICYHDQPKDSNLWRPRVLSRAWLLGKNRTLFMRKHGNIYIYTIFLIPLFIYYFLEARRFNIINRWYELIQGTIAGYFHPINKDLHHPIPQIKRSYK